MIGGERPLHGGSDPRPVPGRGRSRPEARRRILEAAREVFFRSGFVAANLDEVAHRAGVAKGTLYRYFESKADLYVAVLAHNAASFVQKLRGTVEPGLEAPEQIRRTALFYLDHYVRNRDYFQIFWAIENQSVIGTLPHHVLDEVRGLWEQCVQVLAEIVQRGIERRELIDCDPWSAAHLMWTWANATIQTEFSPTRRLLRRRGLDDAYREGLGLVLRGLVRRRDP